MKNVAFWLYGMASLALLSTTSIGCALSSSENDMQEEEDVGVAQQALFAYKGVLLIDRTGSMTVTRSTGRTRCQDALTQAKEAVEEYFASPVPTTGNSLAIWTFTNSSVTKLTGYVNKTQALNAINSLSPTGCSGITPLADAICAAANELSTMNPKPNAIHVSTDGYENNSRGECSGPWGDPWTPGTWQYKVRQKILSAGVRTNSAYWTAPTALNLTGSNETDLEKGSKSPSGFFLPSATGACSTVAQCEALLFQTLAAETDGTYRHVKDNNTSYPCSYGSCPSPDGPIYW